MKRLIPLIVLLLLAGIAWFLSSQGGTSAPTSTGTGPAPGQVRGGGGDVPDAAERALNRSAEMLDDAADDGEGLVEEDLQPASRVYKSADEAIAAVKRAAADYDDIVLEQFVEPGEDCAWCDSFYGSLRDMVTAPGVTPEQQSYYAEILAISGRLPNIQALVENIKNAPNSDTADRFAEALELTLGRDDSVAYLGEQFGSDNPLLRESAVAAVTNQGSRLSAELLYKHTVEKGDPDGYYSVGIGLGEFVPDDEVLPYLHELVLKRDQYSHLAVKSLLNNGLPGLRVVFDVLTNSKDPEADRQMLKDAVDHVSFDDETEEFLKTTAAGSGQPLVQEFAKKILEDFEAEGDDYEDDDEEI